MPPTSSKNTFWEVSFAMKTTTDDLIQKAIEAILDKQLSGYNYLISDYATSSQSEARYAKEQQEERKKIVKELLSLVHKIKDEAKREAIEKILRVMFKYKDILLEEKDSAILAGMICQKMNYDINSLKEDGGK